MDETNKKDTRCATVCACEECKKRDCDVCNGTFHNNQLLNVKLEHITSGVVCWCDPEILGDLVIHKRTDN